MVLVPFVYIYPKTICHIREKKTLMSTLLCFRFIEKYFLTAFTPNAEIHNSVTKIVLQHSLGSGHSSLLVSFFARSCSKNSMARISWITKKLVKYKFVSFLVVLCPLMQQRVILLLPTKMSVDVEQVRSYKKNL